MKVSQLLKKKLFSNNKTEFFSLHRRYNKNKKNNNNSNSILQVWLFSTVEQNHLETFSQTVRVKCTLNPKEQTFQIVHCRKYLEKIYMIWI